MAYKEVVGKEFARRKKLNPSEPDPVPHPDDIIVNMSTGEVEIRGPMTEQEKIVWDGIEDTEATIAELEGMLVKDPKATRFSKKTSPPGVNSENCTARAVPDYKPRPSRRHARQKAKLRAFKSFLKQMSWSLPQSHLKKMEATNDLVSRVILLSARYSYFCVLGARARWMWRKRLL